MEQPLLQVQNLAVDFIAEGAITPAVKGISFDVAAGQIVAVVGESGSGKSVTSLALMGLLPSQAIVKGSAIFKTRYSSFNLLSGRKQQTARGKDISMIFQEPMTSLNPVFTCGDQVMEAILQHQRITRKQAKEQVIDLFKKVQLPNPASFLKKYPHQISGGQKQRVMIAMAMSNSPALLIADEPTTALDVTVQKAILELMKKLQQESGMGILLITHDMGLVADVADKVLVMFKGSIVEQGSTADVLQNPMHPYTRALMACRPAGHPRGARLPVVSDFLKDDSRLPFADTAEKNVEQKPVKSDRDSVVLEVKNLQVYFNPKKRLFLKATAPYKAVDDVSFTVVKGETLGLVGESGCGKTTLGRAILQLISATSGSILLNGTDIARLTKKAFRPLRKDLQIVFQDPYGSLNPRISIGEAILEPVMVHRIADSKTGKEKVIELLEKVNLQPEHFNRYPHQFSGGQRQRICIARALALNPSFLIFDESVSALDVSVQAQVLNLLNDLKREFEFTSIFISHDLSVVRYISDRIMVMRAGKIVEQGTADEIYYTPKNEYTQQLIAAIPGKGLIT